MRKKSGLEGRRISREEAMKGLGDPKTWKKDADKLYREFRKKLKR